MLKVVVDTIGVHDSTVPACDPTRYAVDFGVLGHRNCLENLHDGLSTEQSGGSYYFSGADGYGVCTVALSSGHYPREWALPNGHESNRQ